MQEICRKYAKICKKINAVWEDLYFACIYAKYAQGTHDRDFAG